MSSARHSEPIRVHAALAVSPSEIERVHGMLETFWRTMERIHEPPTPSWRAAFETAVVEIAMNVLRYAYPPETAIASRGAVNVELWFDEIGVHAEILDHGLAFSTSDIVTMSAMPMVAEDIPVTDLPESGMGLPIVVALVDVLDYGRTPSDQNRWLLTKYWTSAPISKVP